MHDGGLFSDKFREVIMPDGSLFHHEGRTMLENVRFRRDGSFRFGPHRKETLVNADGTVFAFEGQTVFTSIHRNLDGSTQFQRGGDEYADTLVEKSGEVFAFEGRTAFYRITRTASGHTTIRSGGKDMLILPDGTVFEHDGQREFEELFASHDFVRIPYILYTTEYRPPAQSAYGDRALQTIVEEDGTVFGVEGTTKFYDFSRFEDGSTRYKIGKDDPYRLLLPDRKTLFSYK